MSYTTTITEAVAELDRYDAIIDVRSPAEFAEDHMPGALNWPVLDDQERHDVGLLYASSPFEARKLGSALVARNIARHIEASTSGLPKTWRPLVYCWRGGQRSGSMHWFLGQIGFRSRQLTGGYKAYRARVRDDLAALPAGFSWQVLCGRTGSGKTRLLHALALEGAQVLDLEALAAHRGSVLGALPDAPQPSQKAFDSQLWAALRALDPARPVFVESESRKIGRIAVPEALLAAMRGERGLCIWIEMPEAARVELLLQDYGHFGTDPDTFCSALDGLVELRGHARVAAWQAQARSGDWAGVFAALMREHYDPGYERSLRGHFPALARARHLPVDSADARTLKAAAQALLQG
ncbi:tRNA 2-selenouridine(34) synthase MnmH [Roseateles saccharophilus]|uniref:tRNA 2-selenouridine synthase n=1 Tax=Roseateles saccharophilus TaxID=304 RepID=A0A4R3VI19_ROSSA|nr:tRNA 2-selenouridine(34) synthase MnmH [Roseateles saccharophilus]MDG0835977.1 tRNA 2-selenouridine(34) synthase MnmH [Roseateles saccharophilus]TCV03408.1 tRNA 2-selenouridine synthase [Roseateles saccharophilus]